MKKLTDIDEGTIRRIDWQELVPPTILLRAFSATFKPTFLFIGAFLAAIFATFMGFQPIGATHTNFFAAMKNVAFDEMENAPLVDLSNIDPVCTLGSISFTPSPLLPCFALFGSVVALWFALAVARTAVVRLTSSARSSTIASMLFASMKFRSILPSAFLPFLFALGAAIAAYIASHTGGFGIACAPIVVLVEIGFIVGGIVLALAFPFSLTAVAAENSDCFDAISRGISYVTQRFLFLAIYAFFATLLTLFGALVVEVVAEICQHFMSDAYHFADSFWVDFWRFVVILLPYAYIAVSTIVYSAAIYIALRRSVDGTSYDSCVLDLSGRKPRELRRMLKDGKGAPTFDAENAKNAQEKNEEKSEDSNP